MTPDDLRRKAIMNLTILSVALLCTYSSMRTLSNAQKYIVIEMSDNGEKIKSDIALSISFVFLSVTYWIAPSVINITGPRMWLFIFTLACILHTGQFLSPKAWSIYILSGIMGILAALSSTAHGNYIIINSTQHTIGRNSGIFWAIIQCSLFIGNLAMFITFKKTTLNKETRSYLIIFLLIMCVCGTFIMSSLQKGVYSKTIHTTPWKSFVNALKLFITRDMLLLSLTFIYNGIQGAFMSGVYSNAIGFTEYLNKESSIRTIALSGMIIGAGNAIGGFLFGVLGPKIIRWGQYPVVITGCLLHTICYILIFLNLPNDSIRGFTSQPAAIKSNLILALFCSFILGFGEACYNTQIIAIIGRQYAAESVTAFALSLFVTNFSTAIAFFYNSMGLYPVVGILMGMNIVGTCSFCYVELRPKFKTSKKLPESFDDYDSYMMDELN